MIVFEKTLGTVVIPFIEEIIEPDKKIHRKQRHTVTRILERLREECGYTGGKTIIFDLIRKLREKSKKCYAPLAKTPGCAQFDFGYPPLRKTLHFSIGNRSSAAHGII